MFKRKGLVVVSGASSGIGRAIASRLLDDGYSVLGLARDFSRSGLQHENFSSVELDLSDIDKLPAAIAALIETLKLPVRALVNNAGAGKIAYLEQLSVADMRWMMDLNFMSHAIITKSFLPILKRQQQGDIFFLGSEAALQGARQGSIYCASKFAIRGFAQSLREECGKSNVRVSLINPGAVRTNFFARLDYEPGDAAENAIAPEAIASALVTVLEAPTGTVFDEINLSPLNRVWQKKV